MTESPLLQLPDEMVHAVCLRLSEPRSIVRFGATCKALHALVNDDDLWAQILRRDGHSLLFLRAQMPGLSSREIYRRVAYGFTGLESRVPKTRRLHSSVNSPTYRCASFALQQELAVLVAESGVAEIVHLPTAKIIAKQELSDGNAYASAVDPYTQTVMGCTTSVTCMKIAPDLALPTDVRPWTDTALDPQYDPFIVDFCGDQYEAIEDVSADYSDALSLLHVIDFGHGSVWSCCSLKDGDVLASTDRHYVHLFNCATGEKKAAQQVGDSTYGCVHVPETNEIYAASSTLSCFDLERMGESTTVTDFNNEISAVQIGYDPLYRYVLALGQSMDVTVFDPRSRTKVQAFSPGDYNDVPDRALPLKQRIHNGWAYWSSFCGTYALVGGDDGTVYVFDARRSFSMVRLYRGFDSGVVTVDAFNAQVLLAGNSANVRLLSFRDA